MRAYVEVLRDDVGGASYRAWSFDLEYWGVSAIADSLPGALTSLQRVTGDPMIELEEVVDSPDPAFARDLEPAAPGERAATLTIMESSRSRTLELVRAHDLGRLLRPTSERPAIDAWGWSSAHALALSFADSESRIYPSALGLPTREKLDDLVAELEDSHVFAMRNVAELPDVLIRATDEGGEWTSVKMLRLLAWRERAEFGLLQALVSD